MRLSSVTQKPNYEMFGARRVPFHGDYNYVSSVGAFAFGTWTDNRNVRPGNDPAIPVVSASTCTSAAPRRAPLIRTIPAPMRAGWTRTSTGRQSQARRPESQVIATGPDSPAGPTLVV